MLNYCKNKREPGIMNLTSFYNIQKKPPFTNPLASHSEMWLIDTKLIRSALSKVQWCDNRKFNKFA